MKNIKILIILFLISGIWSCKKYLDIVPDNVATIEYAFRTRSTTERFLFTCYSFLPQLGNLGVNPAIFGADEVWFVNPTTTSFAPWNIARGRQNVNAPFLNHWSSSTGYWRAIRECNIFLENIRNVKDLDVFEKRQWESEVKFLKAYYHFYLLKMYGPIPIIKENISISASEENVRVSREPVDDVFDYIVELIDEAMLFLPEVVLDDNSELGRITQPIALSIKAKVLTYAASPLFNGNQDYQDYRNKDGTLLFNPVYSVEKWQRAADACKEAIDLCHAIGMKLYYFEETHQAKNLSVEIMTQMNTRNSFTERWNSEVIWASGGSTRDLVIQATPKLLPAEALGNSIPQGNLAVSFKIASAFYTKNGVPINEDNTWDFNSRFQLRRVGPDDKYLLKEGYTTAEFNFDREPRFYSTLGFDGGLWYGHGYYDDKEQIVLETKMGQSGGKRGMFNHAVTGYLAKKYVYYTNVLSTTANLYTTTDYRWTRLRLTDLYLLLAEAQNEAQGPNSDSYKYLNLVRERAGLLNVEDAWTNHSRFPNKYTTQDGLREIIQRERTIELALEGQRFWDLRRWKTALIELNKPITGWDMDQSLPEAYYREKLVYSQQFSLKDYFWPISEYDLIVNKNLVQSPGW